MTNLLNVDGVIMKLAQSYKIWSIGPGQTVPVLPQRDFREGSDRNYSLKGSPPRKYLQREKQTFGINLGWAGTPVFEWMLLGGPRGGPVGTGARLAIHNAKAATARVPGVLIHFDRTVGGDIGWPDSQTWWDQVKDKLAGLTSEAITRLVMAKLNGR